MISIVMTCKDHFAYTRLAVERLIKYTGNDFELIIADDSKTPVENEIRDLLTGLEEYKILRPEKRRTGVAQARNDTLREAKYKFAVNVDNDVMVTPNWDIPLIEALEKHKDFGLVISMSCDLCLVIECLKYFKSDIPLIQYYKKFKELEKVCDPDFVVGGSSELQTIIDKTYDGSLNNFAKAFPSRMISQNQEFVDYMNTWACWAVAMDTMREVGGYDEHYLKAGWEDIDLAQRFNMLGLRSVICFSTLTHHCGGTTRSQASYRTDEGGTAAEIKNSEYYKGKFSNVNLNPRENWI